MRAEDGARPGAPQRSASKGRTGSQRRRGLATRGEASWEGAGRRREGAGRAEGGELARKRAESGRGERGGQKDYGWGSGRKANGCITVVCIMWCLISKSVIYMVPGQATRVFWSLVCVMIARDGRKHTKDGVGVWGAFM